MNIRKQRNLHRILYIVFAAVTIWPAAVMAQKQGQARIDSLLLELPKMQEDTIKAAVLCRIAFIYSGINPDNGIRYANASLALAQKLGWQLGIGEAYNNLAINHVYKSDNVKAIDYWTRALKAYEMAGNKKGRLRIIGNLGNLYMVQGDYSSALESDLRALKLAEELGDKTSIELNLGNIGSIYESLHIYDKSLEYHRKALTIARELGDKTRIANNLGNIGNVFLDLKQADTSLYYHRASLREYETLGNNEGTGRAYINIGGVYLKQNEYIPALEQTFKARKLFKTMGYDYGIARAERMLGEIYLAMAKDTAVRMPPAEDLARIADFIFVNQQNTALRNTNSMLAEAAQFVTNAITINQQLRILDDLQACYLLMSEIQTLLGNYALALRSHQHYTKLKDSVFSITSKVKIANLETKRELELKDKQIELDKLAVLKKRNERGFFIAGMVLLVAIIYVVFRHYRAQRVLNKLLHEEKQKVEEQAVTLKNTNQALGETLINLRATQEQLIVTEKQKENEIIRSRISQDIHDDISSELTKISWISALAKAKAKKEDIGEVTALLEKISGYSQGTVAKLGEIIWTVNPKNDSLDSLLSYMRNYVAKFLTDTPFEYSIRFPDTTAHIIINPELKRNLFLVLKEALNNAVKYSKATTIEVTFALQDRRYILTVADNGVGIDKEVVQGGGNGMGNMRKRMEAVKGDIEIASAPGNGTRIALTGTLY